MSDESYIERCLELAVKGKGLVNPNPLVGCVITKNGRIIGEGYHHSFGGPHAEVNAINSVMDKSEIEGSTVYVSLEPCAHHGKTPPCANALVKHSVKRVVICNKDPYEAVNGAGIKILEEAGIQVESGVLAEKGRAINKVFFTNVHKKRAYISLKWAESADGFISPSQQEEDKSYPISNDQAQLINHRLRSEVDAILIGKNTFKKDKPKLSTRYVSGKDAIVVVLDSKLELLDEIANHFKGRKIIVFTRLSNVMHPDVQCITSDMSINDICKQLHINGISHVMIEGGLHVLNSCIKEDCWDEAHRFISNFELHDGTSAPKIEIKTTFATSLNDNTYEFYVNA